MEQLIYALKKHELQMIYVDNMWILSTTKPKMTAKHINNISALLLLIGKLINRHG